MPACLRICTSAREYGASATFGDSPHHRHMPGNGFLSDSMPICLHVCMWKRGVDDFWWLSPPQTHVLKWLFISLHAHISARLHVCMWKWGVGFRLLATLTTTDTCLVMAFYQTPCPYVCTSALRMWKWGVGDFWLGTHTICLYQTLCLCCIPR